MDRLPQEILIDIFNELSLIERVNCLYVCRKWNNLLNNYCLFSSIKIANDLDLFTKAMDLKKRSPEYAAQVRELKLFTTFAPCYNDPMFWTVFPNLQILNVKYTQAEKIQVKYDLVQSCPILNQTLPPLRKIRVENIYISLQDLELLQQNLPTLKDVDIAEAHVTTSRMPDNVEVSQSIHRFTITISKVQDVETHIQVYQYMLRKYVNTAKCFCSDFQMRLYDADTQQRIFNNGAMQFLKLNAPKDPSSLCLNGVPNEIDAFRELDTGDYQFDHLEASHCGGDAFFENLVNSGFPSHIKSITLKSTEMKSPDLLERLPALNSISIFKLEGNLTKYLNGCRKTVKDFSMRCNKFIVNPLDTKLTFIENLELQCLSITPALCDVISNGFPNLVKLKLTGDLTEEVSIVLVSDSLESVELIWGKGRYGYLIGEIEEQELRYYLLTEEQFTRSTYQEIEHLPKSTLITKKRLFCCLKNVQDI